MVQTSNLSPLVIIIIVVVTVYLVKKKLPLWFVSDSSTKSKGLMTIDDKYNSKKVAEEKELNTLLEKINKKGYDNLSTHEKTRLDSLSKKKK